MTLINLYLKGKDVYYATKEGDTIIWDRIVNSLMGSLFCDCVIFGLYLNF